MKTPALEEWCYYFSTLQMGPEEDEAIHVSGTSWIKIPVC